MPPPLKPFAFVALMLVLSFSVSGCFWTRLLVAIHGGAEAQQDLTDEDMQWVEHGDPESDDYVPPKPRPETAEDKLDRVIEGTRNNSITQSERADTLWDAFDSLQVGPGRQGFNATGPDVRGMTGASGSTPPPMPSGGETPSGHRCQHD